MSFSAPLPGARVTFSCLAKRKSPKRRPPREHVLSTSVCSGCACGRRGSPTAHPCTCGELSRILRAILRTDPSPARRVRGAPISAHPARPCGKSKLFRLASSEATMAVIEADWGPCASGRAGREGPQGGRNGLRPLAAAPGMARRQARPARSDFSSTDGRKTQHRGGLLFGNFLLATQEKVTRPPGRRTEKDRDVELETSREYVPSPGASPLPAEEGNRASKARHARPAHAIVPCAPIGIEPREPEAAPEQRQRYQRQHETRTRGARIDA